MYTENNDLLLRSPLHLPLSLSYIHCVVRISHARGLVKWPFHPSGKFLKVISTFLRAFYNPQWFWATSGDQPWFSVPPGLSGQRSSNSYRSLRLGGFGVASWPPQKQHTYLAQKAPWSARRSFQSEACPLHFGRADLCDRSKCEWLGCAISGSRGAASARSPEI